MIRRVNCMHGISEVCVPLVVAWLRGNCCYSRFLLKQDKIGRKSIKERKKDSILFRFSLTVFLDSAAVVLLLFFSDAWMNGACAAFIGGVIRKMGAGEQQRRRIQIINSWYFNLERKPNYDETHRGSSFQRSITDLKPAISKPASNSAKASILPPEPSQASQQPMLANFVRC
ncbi:uncharacterized protein LOC106093013 [Stomoxys calcitrans]|uniref:uncharacterized protein LOC106093013 n=1 Tax=Stomoxys calcitrans TaxID=35570 RepID=UPI0027E2977D|nr:uncharacterized protein LOC106093013 [Stomoxys calcitrans]